MWSIIRVFDLKIIAYVTHARLVLTYKQLFQLHVGGVVRSLSGSEFGRVSCFASRSQVQPTAGSRQMKCECVSLDSWQAPQFACLHSESKKARQSAFLKSQDSRIA